MTHKLSILPDFLQIPYEMVLDRDIRPNDYVVYATVLFYSEGRGSCCYATNSEIAAIALSTATTVSNSLKRLEDRGYIIRDFGGGTNVPQREITPLV